MSSHTPQKVPEHFSRVDIGAYMRELRLHYGLSEQDVSERLHIRVKYVSAIENAQFDLMPGKAYARGYVHTYAEFLGLDADQIVERCFGGEMAREVQEHSIPESSNWYKRNKAYGGVLAVLLLLGALFYFAAPGDTTPDEPTADVSDAVESVPEEYLASMRNRLMPTAENYECLGDETPLGCYYSQRLTKLWATSPAAPDMAPVRVDEAPEQDEEVNDEAPKQTEVSEEAPKKEEAAPKKEESKPAAKPAAAKPEPKKEAATDRGYVYHPPPPPGLQKTTEEEQEEQRPANLPDPNLAIPDEPAPTGEAEDEGDE